MPPTIVAVAKDPALGAGRADAQIEAMAVGVHAGLGGEFDAFRGEALRQSGHSSLVA